MIQQKRRNAFLTRQTRLVKFTKQGAKIVGISKEEFDRLIEIEFIKPYLMTICTECFREIKEEDCKYCGEEEASITTNDFYMYNDQYNGPMPPFE